jgi:peroxiredoxin
LRILRALVFLLYAISIPAAQAQLAASSIGSQIKDLRSVPDDRRSAVTAQISEDIRSLPAGLPKLQLADALSHLVTEGDPGQHTLQSVGDTLAQALRETPVPSSNGLPPIPYMDLARLVRYEGISTDLQDPLLQKALATYAANDADAASAGFTLKDLKGNKIRLSELRGKVVLVSFWATWCPPCRNEMAALDQIYRQYQQQGLVILSISSESSSTVKSYVRSIGYAPPVLLDEGGRVATQFHVSGIPRTFVFDREGRLASQATDMRTRQQFLRMLATAGLKPI